MDHNPLVSICIPAYNSAQFIGETITSILQQTYPNIEIIVTDDCSKDDTVKVVTTFSDPRVKLYQNEKNLGVEGNWNKSMELASGEYLKVMGADDILFPDCIEEQVKAFSDPSNKSIVLVTAHKKIINRDSREILTMKYPGKGKKNGLAALRKSIRRGTNTIGEPAAGLFRAAILKKSGPFNGENVYLIDLDFWSRILKLGDLFVVDKVLYAFRISHTSISGSIGYRQCTLFNRFVTKLSRDGGFGIGRIDRLIALMMSITMLVLRQGFHLSSNFRKS